MREYSELWYAEEGLARPRGGRRQIAGGGAECGLRGRSRTPMGGGGGPGEGNEPRQLISPGFHNALANERPL